MKKLLLIISYVFLWANLFGQNLEKLGDKEAFKISGSLNTTLLGYTAHGIDPRRDPFNYYIIGGINFSIYDWNIPLTINWSNQGRSFQQPFNQYGVAPEYKWVKAHIGYSNLTFSRYTLNGHIFLGGGLELTPGKFDVSIMYGRLNKAITGDSLRNIDPMFKRMGMGIKAGYADGKDALHIIYFHAWDDPNSLDSGLHHQSFVNPQQNTVVSLVAKKGISKKLSFEAEYALSGLTRNSLQNEGTGTDAGIIRLLGETFQTNRSTLFQDAFNASLNYVGSFYNVNLAFERIDPDYATLGAYFFNNDLQHVTVGGAVRLFDQKLNVNGNIGSQLNNLDQQEASETRRLVHSLNLTYIPGSSWNINASYSNFISFTNMRPQADPFLTQEFDTLNFYQVNQNASGTVAYTFGSQKQRKSLFFTGNYQVTNDVQGSIETGSRFTIVNMAYRFPLPLSETSLALSANVNHHNSPQFLTTSFGPNINISKTMLEKKMRTSLTSTYNVVRTNEMTSSKVMNYRFTLNYNLNKKQSLNFFLNMTRKFGTETSDEQFNEITAQLNYGWRF